MDAVSLLRSRAESLKFFCFKGVGCDLLSVSQCMARCALQRGAQHPRRRSCRCHFLTVRRGRSIHTETLRARLRGVDGEWINLEMLELLTEWMQETRDPGALKWLTR
jgi:hypothetical protein